MSSYYKYPKSLKEKKDWYKHVGFSKDYPELKLKVRRSIKKLADAWDDIPRKDWKIRNWKKHREKQYKIKINKIKKDSSNFSKSQKRRNHWHYQHPTCYIRPCKYCKKHNIKYCGTEMLKAKRRKEKKWAKNRWNEVINLIESRKENYYIFMDWFRSVFKSQNKDYYKYHVPYYYILNGVLIFTQGFDDFYKYY